MTSEGLGEMFECDSADMCAGKFPLVLMGDQVEGLACADPGARTPIGASGFFSSSGVTSRDGIGKLVMDNLVSTGDIDVAMQEVMERTLTEDLILLQENNLLMLLNFCTQQVCS